MSELWQDVVRLWEAAPSNMRRDGGTEAARMLWMRRACLPCPPYSILDLGCGEGAGSLRWVAGDVLVDSPSLGSPDSPELCAGVDVNEKYVQASRDLFPGAKFLVFDLMDIAESNLELPFPGASFDVVLATEVIEHLYLRQWVPFLREARRVAKYQVLLTVPDGGDPNRRVDWYPKPPANQLYVGHQFEPCWRSWQQLIQEGLSPGWDMHFKKIFGFFTACCLRTGRSNGG